MKVPAIPMKEKEVGSRKYGSKTGRSERGRFTAGNSGRPRGALNKTTLAVECLFDSEGEGLARKAIEMALAGDTIALRLCLDRLAPVRRDRVVAIQLPTLLTVADAPKGMAAIVDAVAAGDITPAEATSLAALIDNFVRVAAACDFDSRLSALEKGKSNAA